MAGIDAVFYSGVDGVVRCAFFLVDFSDWYVVARFLTLFCLVRHIPFSACLGGCHF